MQQKAFTLLNKGMNRDLSISKAGESSAYENHNIRILARDHDTLLSVTNERGNKAIVLGANVGFTGELVGWNVLNNHVILFTHDTTSTNNPDRIYRIDYVDDSFYMLGYEDNGTFSAKNKPLFVGNLGFDLEHPIESVVYFETEDIQKIYWVDGKNVLRFMNFMADDEEIARWTGDNTYFDSNRAANFGVTAEITKDNSGNTRANGVVQYLLTYYNKHGQETGVVWVSDLVYLSPVGNGGAADGTNSNKVTIELFGLDTSYSHYRLYSIFRSSLNGTPIAYIVDEGEIIDNYEITEYTTEASSGSVSRSRTGRTSTVSRPSSGSSSSGTGRTNYTGVIRNPSGNQQDTGATRRTTVNVYTIVGYAKAIDDGAHLVAEDVQRLLYLGSQAVIADTLTHKDQTLFLGGLQSIGKKDYDAMDTAIEAMRTAGNCVTFQYSDGDGEICDIPYYEDTGAYNYQSQLGLTSSQILSFKGGEKYRFALTFRRKDGTMTEAFWIGDYENDKYPVIDIENNVIKRIVAKCIITDAVKQAMSDCEFETAQLMIAEATYADRSVKAQGIINPTMFNVWDRFNDRLYSQASWISRPIHSGFAWKHFEPVHNATSSTGEIECNYWETDSEPTPYYRLSSGKYVDEFDGKASGDRVMMIFRIRKINNGAKYEGGIWMVTGTASGDGGLNSMLKYEFSSDDLKNIPVITEPKLIEKTGFDLRLMQTTEYTSAQENSVESLYTQFKSACISVFGLTGNDMVGYSEFEQWCRLAGSTNTYYNRFASNGGTRFDDQLLAFNNGQSPSDSAKIARWGTFSDSDSTDSVDYTPSYYRKHLMFVDENVVTLNSPELTYEAVSFDNAENYKLRIVGLAKITSTSGDYTVDATPGKLPGENLAKQRFAGDIDGIISWPLWREYSLRPNNDNGHTPSEIISKRTSDDYKWGFDTVTYWLHMWNHSGSITTFVDSDNSDYSRLNSKVFANLKYSYNTIYNNSRNYDWISDIPSGALRVFNYTHGQYLGLTVGEDKEYYDANIDDSLLVPGSHKYKILYSNDTPGQSEEATSSAAYLYSSTPVQISYLSSPHAVIALPTTKSGNMYKQTLLPYIGASSNAVSIPNDAIIPWLGTEGTPSSSIAYRVNQVPFNLNGEQYSDAGRCMFIGEIYYDFSDNDTRYGDVKNNRFVVAGPQYTRTQLSSSNIMYANQGDTYFQRWDCLKTKPAETTDATNGVIDITSVMLETHINIDGRTDKQRETGYIASINTEEYGSLNTVYSQQNNYFAQRDLDEDFNQDVYGANITWTLEKHDSAEIDEWSHITLANTLKLDGDKGNCRALRRFQNSIIAFQDKGIAEILFNSRTQLSTSDGVPVELANSGKVDGKRYITNKYGCSNKWSIVEGKVALYFIDNINKAFCAFNGNVDSLSTRLNFDVWFRRDNSSKTWNPKDWDNVVSYYDRIHSDVYLVTDKAGDEACLVYNENLGAFTSFFDYARVPMMTNVGDRFISYRDGLLWRQNEGFYCNFFGEQKDFWVNYRVTPDPYGDKIWTNIDYRADFYSVLDNTSTDIVQEGKLINGDLGSLGSISNTSLIPVGEAETSEGLPIEPVAGRDLYIENETFTGYKVWNDYQTTGYVSVNKDTSRVDPVRKKFRIWRVAIPRAIRHDTNKHGLDRIRNPWVNIEFRKKMTDNRYLMQLHDIVVKYFE